MKVVFYGYPKCGTCRNALKWLAEHGVETEPVNLYETAPTAAQLRRFSEQSGLELNKLFNVSGEVYKELALKNRLAGMDAEEKLNLLASNGRLIKRPIVTDGKRTTVGFKEETYEQVWGR